MKFREITIGLGTIALAVSSSYAIAQTPPPASDASFVQTAQMGNDEEIADARYVLGQLKNPEIRTFANMLISDHSSANVALLRAARSAHVPVPQGMRRTNVVMAPDALRGLSGVPLRDAYLKMEIKGHEKMLALLKAEEGSTTADPALKAYATDQETPVQKHLDAANNIVAVGTAATSGPVLSSAAPGASSVPSPVFTPQTNGGAPTAVPISVPGPSTAPTSGASPRTTATPLTAPPTHSP